MFSFSLILKEKKKKKRKPNPQKRTASERCLDSSLNRLLLMDQGCIISALFSFFSPRSSPDIQSF